MPVILPDGRDATALPIFRVPYKGPHMTPFHRLYKAEEDRNVMLTNGLIEPSEIQLEWLCTLFDRLNATLRQETGGSWSVTWFAPAPTPDDRGQIKKKPTMMRTDWHDVDGDAPFHVEIQESDETLSDIETVDNVVAQCDQAYHEYLGFLRDVEVKDSQKIKFSQGEAVHNPHDEDTPV